MSEAVIVAMITGTCAVAAQFVISFQSSKELFARLEKASELSDAQLDAKLERFQAVTNEKIDELSKRVEKHNNIIERTYKLENLTAVQSEQIKVANHRIDDLEKAAMR